MNKQPDSTAAESTAAESTVGDNTHATSNDPIRHAAAIISGDTTSASDLERRLKSDIVASLARIKPGVTADLDFEADVMQGEFFNGLPAPLQGIAIARTEGALAFYNRVGWHATCLEAPLDTCVPEEGLDPLQNRYHATTLHDLAYVHPKHFEKMLGKVGAATLWETLKRYIGELQNAGEARDNKTE